MTPAPKRQRRRTHEQVLFDECQAFRHRLAEELEAEAIRLADKVKALAAAAAALTTR